MYDLFTQGLSLADAQREVRERFDIEDAPITNPALRARAMLNDVTITRLQHEASLTRALVSDAGMEIGVDEGIPGSDRSVLSVRTGDGHVHAVDTFGITREGDDFVIRTEDGSILGRGSSEEDAMEILRLMLVQWPSDGQPEDEELLVALEDEELLEELDEPSENASRFDIIDIE